MPDSYKNFLAGGSSVSSDGTVSTTTPSAFDDITINEGKNIIVGTTTGTKIGTATTQKLGFYNKAPITQPTTIAATNTGTVDATYGQAEADVINDLRTKFDDLVAKVKSLGLIA